MLNKRIYLILLWNYNNSVLAEKKRKNYKYEKKKTFGLMKNINFFFFTFNRYRK